MKKEVEIIEYSSERGIQLVWEDGSTIKTSIQDNVVVIRGDTAGLVSLAQHLLKQKCPRAIMFIMMNLIH
ncbi:hypothetical protein SY83_11060 [Paenibacillus swuensis]|uniref:Uncharacterized protein n=1 Tax=Paenibacillus swuensis TaxID=1178515 RepID=A0A172TI55_9BACL|nr:hypothetical protein [Paenibacillus swuensis]ANE46721.1 hypothetical protein SY83_11060 [Paenibacillus swuensis]